MQKKLLFILNPRAGRGMLKDMLFDIVALFSEHGFAVTVVPTREDYTVSDIVAQHTAGHDLVVCSGGDGTMSETMGALRALPNPPPLGYIPAGTTNDFAHSLGYTGDFLLDAKLIATGQIRLFDIGKLNETHFTYIAAFGMFTEVSYSTNQTAKNIFGRAAYIIEGIASLAETRGYPMKITTEDSVFEGSFLFGSVSNSKCIGGFNAQALGADLDDGLFEVLLVRTPKTIIDLAAITAALLAQKPDGENVILTRCTQLHVEAEETIPWTVDGEYGGALGDAMIRNLPRALRLVVPSEIIN